MVARHIIGIDVGGTKIAGGLVDVETGQVSLLRRCPTGTARGGKPVLDDVAAMARGLLQEAVEEGLCPRSMGIGVPELVSPDGKVFSSFRVDWPGLDAQAVLGAILPTVLCSDVQAAALAEARFGAGRGLSDFYYVTIGTGVSGVLVQGGIPYVGGRGAALVIANGTTSHRCLHCGRVSETIVEDVASGPGLAAAYGASAEEALAACERGVTTACDAVDRATFELGRVIALLADSLDPEAIVVGGGLGAAPGPYFDGLSKVIRAGLWPGYEERRLAIVRANLGVDAGLVGAAMYSALHFESEPTPLAGAHSDA